MSMEVGDRIRLVKGWWIYDLDAGGGFQATGQEVGIVNDTHDHPDTLYVELDGGNLVSAAIAGMVKE